jgi:diaminopimelate epimerase
MEGETGACGTGSVAIVAAATRLGLIEPTDAVDISVPGGELRVTRSDRGGLELTGGVVHEFDGDAAAVVDD